MQLTLGELVTPTLSRIEVQGKKERNKKLFILEMKKEPLIRTQWCINVCVCVCVYFLSFYSHNNIH